MLYTLLRIAPCSRVKDLAHGRITTQGVKHSEKVYFECAPDYVLEGNSVITCLDGRWSGRVPQCLGKFFFGGFLKYSLCNQTLGGWCYT